MNSSKLHGSPDMRSAGAGCASAAVLSRIPSAQQSFTGSTLQWPLDPLAFRPIPLKCLLALSLPLACPLVPPHVPFTCTVFDAALAESPFFALKLPKRASIAPVMHSLITFAGRP